MASRLYDPEIETASRDELKSLQEHKLKALGQHAGGSIEGNPAGAPVAFNADGDADKPIFVTDIKDGRWFINK